MTLHYAEDTDSCVCMCVSVCERPPPLSHGWISEVCDQWDDFLKLHDPALRDIHNLPVLVLKEHTHIWNSQDPTASCSVTC